MTEFSSETDGSEPDGRGQPFTNTDEELKNEWGTPWWSSDKTPLSQRRGPRLDPWAGN